MERSFFDWVVYILQKYGMDLLKGTGTTMLIAVIGTIVGFLIGLLIGCIRTIPISAKDKHVKKALLKLVNLLLNIYIEVFRGTPMMVQATVIYFGLMEAFGIDMSPLTAGLLVVSINTGAYMAEIVRGGIQSIDRGQYEAAHALGLSHWGAMFNVILPQAIRNILPAIGNEFVVNIKDTSVLNVISVTELFFSTRSIKGALARTYEPFLICGVIYLILTFTTTRILRLIEKKMDGPDSYTILGSGSSATAPMKVLPKKGAH